MERTHIKQSSCLALRAINGSAPLSKEIPLILTLGYEHGPLPLFNLKQMKLLWISWACCCLCCKCRRDQIPPTLSDVPTV